MSVLSVQLIATAIVFVVAAAGGPRASGQASGQTAQKPDAVIVQGDTSMFPLSGTRWALASATLPVPAPEDTSRVTLAFRGAALNMSSGCNRGSTGYSVSPANQRLSISTYTVTRMACSAPVMEWETAFFKFLGARPTVTRDGESLVLKTADGELKFKRVLE